MESNIMAKFFREANIISPELVSFDRGTRTLLMLRGDCSLEEFHLLRRDN
jgi:hypothetical protein